MAGFYCRVRAYDELSLVSNDNIATLGFLALAVPLTLAFWIYHLRAQREDREEHTAWLTERLKDEHMWSKLTVTPLDESIADDEFEAVLSLLMASDPSPLSDRQDDLVRQFANREAKKRGFPHWTDAYMQIEKK